MNYQFSLSNKYSKEEDLNVLFITFEKNGNQIYLVNCRIKKLIAQLLLVKLQICDIIKYNSLVLLKYIKISTSTKLKMQKKKKLN